MIAATQVLNSSNASFTTQSTAQSPTTNGGPIRKFFAVLLRCLSAFNA